MTKSRPSGQNCPDGRSPSILLWVLHIPSVIGPVQSLVYTPSRWNCQPVSQGIPITATAGVVGRQVADGNQVVAPLTFHYIQHVFCPGVGSYLVPERSLVQALPGRYPTVRV